MNLLMLTSSVSKNAGGIFDAVRHLSAAMLNRAHCNVQVFGLADQHSKADLGEWGAVPVQAFDVIGPGSFGYAPGLFRALQRLNPSVLHIHGLWTYPSIASLNWGRTCGKHYVVSPHGMLDPWAVRHSYWKKRLAAVLYERRNLRSASCLHALTEAEAEAFREYGLRNPVSVIPNGVLIRETRTERLAPWTANIPSDSRIMLYLGRIHPKKGLRNLIQAWCQKSRQAKQGGWHLVIAGWDQGGHELELKSLVRSQGLSETVHFVGPQFGEDKAACYESADAFVLPSVSEGLPMTVLEAWAAQLPVLMTPHCNLPYGFSAGAAIRIEPEPDSIAAGLQSLFNLNNAQRTEIGRRGLGLVKERHQWSSVSAEMRKVYEWIQGHGARPSSIVTP